MRSARALRMPWGRVCLALAPTDLYRGEMTTDSHHPARAFPELAAALGGQYELERELGRGGMGVVFLARDLKLERSVAIKTLLPHLVADERVRERFIREARTAAALAHPGIVPIHRADEVNGQVFFVMGFVEGASLAQQVRDRGPLPPREVTGYLRDVAAALGAAHERGVIHRDVKAENILIERGTGRAVVTDFGIARLAEASPLTATGLVLGTVYYMSPEQVSAEAVDGRSDIYSLGVVAYHALSGRFPFESETASAVLVAHVTKAPPRLASVAPDIFPSLGRLVDRCIAKDPADRYSSCAALGDALAEVTAELIAAETPPSVAPADAQSRKRAGVVVSEPEAQAIWERAAQLQAHPDAPPIRHVEREQREASKSSGYPLEVVRDSAREAGISTGFVDRALVERGLADAPAAAAAAIQRRDAPAGSPGTSLVHDMAIDEPSPWIGARSSIDFEVVVDHEMPERDFDWLIESIRRTLGDVGVVGTVGRTLSWSSTDPERKIHITVQVRGGRTTIRVGERLAPLRNNVFGGGVGGFGAGGGSAVMGLLLGTAHMPYLAIASAGLVLGSSYVGSRFVYARLVNSRARSLRALTDRLGEEVRHIIAERDREAKPRLGRPSASSR
jgi:serine/threonine-protein kinase